jgi:hypothetical protein
MNIDQAFDELEKHGIAMMRTIKIMLAMALGIGFCVGVFVGVVYYYF